MLRQLFTLLLAFQFYSATADVPLVSYSDYFAAPNCVTSRVVQSKNGNTFLFNFRQSGGEFLMFGSNRELIKRANFSGKLAALGIGTKAHIEGIYELNERLVFFMTQSVGTKAVLNRISMNPTTGEIEGEQTIAEVEWKLTGMWHTFEGKIYTPYRIAVDAAAGTYAVSFPGNKVEPGMVVQLFDANHREIKRYPYKFSSPKRSELFAGRVVLKDSTIYLLATEWDKESDRKLQAKPVISIIRPGTEEVKQQELPVTSDLRGADYYFTYHAGWDKLILINYKEAGEYKWTHAVKHEGNITVVDAKDLTVLNTQELNYDPISLYGQERLGEKTKFVGAPYDFRMNQDLSLAIISEEVVQDDRSPSGNSAIGNQQTMFADMGVMYLDATGKISNAFKVHNCQRSKIFSGPGHSMNKVASAVDIVPKMPDFDSYDGVDFYSFDYVHGSTADYFIYNSHPENFDLPAEKNAVCIGSLPRTSTMVTRVGSEGQSRGYFWGAPDGQFDYRFTVIGSSNYQASTGTYAVLIVEQKGKNMRTRLAWATLN